MSPQERVSEERPEAPSIEPFIASLDRNWAKFWTPNDEMRCKELLRELKSRRAADALNEWQPIETAPIPDSQYFFCRLAWGPADDLCTGEGFFANGRWFAAATFHSFDKAKRVQIREQEVTPTHWLPLPPPPSAKVRL